MGYLNVLSREFSNGKSETKDLARKIIGNVIPCIEFEKWLSYESEHEKQRKTYLYKKLMDSLVPFEREELKKYEYYKYYSLILKKYVNDFNSCTFDEYKSLNKFLEEQSIDEIMSFKLSPEEILLGKKSAKNIVKILSNEEIFEYLNNGRNLQNYKNMSMLDAYILHLVSNVQFVRYISNNITKNISK